ncbi:hypothetical protein EI555_003468, partial [Monodon monoceros]
WSGLGSAARGRARLPLGTLWFFLSPRKWFRAGFGKVGPWWGRGWEDGVARLGAERLGLWSGVGPAGGRPQLRGAHCSPGSAAAARAQQKCGFRKAPRKVEPRRSDTGTSSEAYKRSALIPPVEETAFYPSPYPIRTLVKPLFFTVGFTGCAFGSAAIWQYESLKSRVQSYFDGIKADWLDSIRPQKEGDFRK